MPEESYKQFSVTMTLNFDVLNLPDVELSEVCKVVTKSRWDEGRYPFMEEMLHQGLSDILEYAVREAVYQQLQEEYKGQMTVIDQYSQTSTASLLTKERCKHFCLRILDSIKVATITPLLPAQNF